MTGACGPGDGVPLIECRGLGLSRGGHPVLRQVDLTVGRAEIVGVLGRSGVGKSTLLRCIVGLERPDRGCVKLMGQDIGGLGEDELNSLRRQVGLVFQSAALFDSLSVFENVAFYPRRFLRLTESELGELVARHLAVVGLPGTERLMPAQLSGGMAKRVGIARCLAAEPKVILYDEPTAGLDPVMAAVLDRVIVDLRDDLGISAVVVTHDVRNALAVVDRAALLHDGTIYFEGRPDAFAETADPLVRQFVDGAVDGPLTDG